jgi:lipoic acid synthetase
MTIGKPEWLKQKVVSTAESRNVRRLLGNLGLNTVCLEANCPNRSKCYGDGTSTFLIMGKICTRNCRFCNIVGGIPSLLDPGEPENVAKAAEGMNLNYIVITSVTRDDLPDGGAGHFAKTIRAIRKLIPKANVEVLIPDLQGNLDSLQTVLSAKPDVLNHNIETAKELYPTVRPSANYDRSRRILREAKKKGFITKSGIILGLGETDEQILRTISDLADDGLDILTIGQYLAPSKEHHPVARYFPPPAFDFFAVEARRMGIAQAVSGPLVRSSFRAGEVYKTFLQSTQTPKTKGG